MYLRNVTKVPKGAFKAIYDHLGTFIGWELIQEWHYPDGRGAAGLSFSKVRITEAVWKGLPRYDISTPTGVVEGKVWREHCYDKDGRILWIWLNQMVDVKPGGRWVQRRYRPVIVTAPAVS